MFFVRFRPAVVVTVGVGSREWGVGSGEMRKMLIIHSDIDKLENQSEYFPPDR
jgi:hypothetical protein